MRILEQEPLSSHTTFRIGGPASYYMIPGNAEEIREGIHFAREQGLPFITIGRGSNMLFPDEGYDGVVLEIGSGMNQIEYCGAGKIRAQAGALLSAIASEAARHSLTGFEFAGGIPGTLGGAVVMNAGAYGGEIKDCILGARVMDSAGNESWLDREQLELGYRTSVIQRQGALVLEAVFQFETGDPGEIRERMKELSAKRREKQPLEFASAGSTFKRPEGHFAGKLIQDAGLRGYRIGDAQVSEKHCGFVVNRGHATAKEVLAVISGVQKKVLENSGVMLEPEVKIIQ